jgi:primosomal protein N' (replication factor Y)
LESNGDNSLLSTTASGVLVVATPGSEPDVVGGYDLIVIADAAQMIGAPRLRALEKAVGSWANAISLASKQSLVIFVGLSGVIADQVKDLDFEAIVSADFQDRVSLGLPPSTRVASVISSNQTDFNLLREGLRKAALFDRLRFLPNADKLSLVLDYQYSDGAELGDLLRSLTNLLTTQSKHKKPGERVYRINMDDSKVI